MVMKSYKYYDLDGAHIFTEDQIFEEYWEFWCEAMRRVKRDDLISRERCLEDWITINWAFEVEDDEK